MKNIHVLPTNKPSKLLKQNQGKLIISKEIVHSHISRHLGNINQNTYITNDEEIKDGDYVTNGEYTSQAINEWWTKFYIGNPELEADYWKIILTTDQDLIKDGVQEIDDKFLEWFVKNPSCEWVKTQLKLPWESSKDEYEIIIPKEEPKQHVELINDNIEEFDKAMELFKQETLEEVELAILFHNTYERLAPSFGYETRADTKLFDTTTPNGKLMIAVCKEIIKWQMERSYSEEELDLAKRLFEHLKKK